METKYLVGNKSYNIPNELSSDFERDNPEAKAVFFVDGREAHVPVARVSAFVKKYPNAVTYGMSQAPEGTEVDPIQGVSKAPESTTAKVEQPKVAQPKKEKTNQLPKQTYIPEEEIQQNAEAFEQELGLEEAEPSFKDKLLLRAMSHNARRLGVRNDPAGELLDKINAPEVADENRVEIMNATRDQVRSMRENVKAGLQAMQPREFVWGGVEQAPQMTIRAAKAEMDANKQKHRTLVAANTALENAQNIIDEADKHGADGTYGNWLQTSFVSNAARGLGDKLFDINNWDMGIADAGDAKMLKDALDQFDNGKPLADEQKTLLDAKAVELATQAYFGSYLGRGYKAGQVTAESIPFMIEMAINPASAVGKSAGNAMARYALKRFGKGLATKTLSRGARVLGDVAGAAAMAGTTGAGRVAADTLDRMSGDVIYDLNDDNQSVFIGHTEGMDPAEAVKKAFAATTIENYSEMLGTYFAPLMGGLGKIARKTADKVGLNKAYELLDKVSSSDFARLVTDFEDNAQWSGTIGEYAEEVAGGILNAIFVGDQELNASEKGVFNLDQNIDTFLGVALLGGAMSTMKTVGYPVQKYQANKRVDNANAEALKAFGDKDAWEDMKNKIYSVDGSQRAEVLREVLADKSLTMVQKESTFKFVEALMRRDGARAGYIKHAQDPNVPREQVEIEQSYDNGYTLETSQELNDAKTMLETQAENIRALYALDPDADVDEFLGEDPIEGIMMSLNAGASEEEQQAKMDYLNAKATYDGMIQRVRDDIESQIEANNAKLEGFANTTTGMVVPATLKQDDKAVYVVGGNIVLTEDGSIDTSKSSSTIVVKDPTNGHIEMIAPSAILNMGEQQELEALKSTQAQQISDAYATMKGNEIDGVLPFAQGDTYTILDDQGIQHVVNIVADNGDGTVSFVMDQEVEPTVARKEYVQQMSDAFNKQRAAAAMVQKKTAEVVEEEVAQAVEAPAPQTALERIPENEIGDKRFEDAPAQDTWAALVEMNDGDVVEAEDTATQMLTMAQKELDKAVKEKAKAGSTVLEIQQGKKERKERIAEIQKRVDYWNEVLALKNAMEEAVVEEVAAEPIVKEEVTPIVEEEIAPIIEEAQVEEPIVETEEVVEPIVEQSKPKVKNISKKEDARRKPLRERVAEWVDKLGVPVVVMETFSDIENADAKREIRKGNRISGWYEPSTGAVMVYMPHVTDMSEIDKTITHEIVAHKGLAHMLGKNKHNALLDRVWDMMSEEAKAKYINYPNVNGNTRRAADEYIAFLSEGVNLSELDQSAWDKIVSFVRELLSELGMNIQITDADIADLVRLSYTNLVRENQKVKETKGADDINEQEGQALFSIRTYEESGRENLKKFLKGQVKKKRITKADAEAIEATMEQMYETAVEYKDKFAPFGAWSDAEVVKGKDGNPVFSVVKKNGEYTMNLDFSTVCKKRRTLDAVFSEMIDRGLIDMIPMEGEQIAEINNIIRDYGFETACALCFVDAKRFRVAQVADKFCEMWNPMTNMSEEELQGVIDEYGKKVVRGKIAKHLIEHPEDHIELGRENFIESNGFEQMEINHPEILSLYKQAQGTSLAKIPFGDVQYLNEIEGNSWTPEAAYAVGGVRLQSFSDYVPRMFFDYMQMTAGLASKGLPVHAYTKEPIFAKQFGLTGMKINLSLVPKVVEGGVAAGLDADGNYAWMEGETFPFEEAMALQNAEGYRENCGTIAVGVSDEHIEKMLDDPNIRMIIPYHKSGLNPLVAKKNRIAEFTDYTNVQNTRSANGTKLEKENLKDMPNFNSLMHDEGMDARQAAQVYLDWCDSKGFIPKFNKFRGHKNYYKLLEDFTTIVPNADGVETTYPQREVTMTFPTEESAFGSIESLIREGLEEDAILEGKREEKLGEIVDTIEKELVKFRVAPEMDAQYLSLVEEGNLEEAQKMVGAAANAAGYNADESWKKAHRAPRKSEYNVNPFNTEELVPADYWTHPEWYTQIRHNQTDRESYYNMMPAINKYKRLVAEGKQDEADKIAVTMYRGVDKRANKKESTFRNGDWITPSRSYALMSAPYGNARVISQDVLLKDIWWDGNSINEWGYDDGANYVYQDTKNNRKSADAVTYDDNGNVIPLSKRFNKRSEDVRFRVADPAPAFYSNAENAVLGIKQEKATPEQWLKMIEKNGGLKAGEDKWLGLSDWLKASDKKTLTKQEVLDFIKENQIQIEEDEYHERETTVLTIEGSQEFINLHDEYSGLYEDALEDSEADMGYYEAEQYARDAMREKFGYYFDVAFTTHEGELYVNDEEFAAKLLGLPVVKELNQTRLDYTTKGLVRKKEIALTIPTIEPWNETDNIHFGDAGDGRAIAWIRFGETTDADGKRVLVIDEIQSKRHQEGREKGYRPSDVDKYLKDNNVEVVETGEFYEFYRDGELDRRFSKGLLHNSIKEAKNLYVAGYNKSNIPEAPFEKNWAELAMKRMLRYAAENGFDKVAWTKGEQQAERYDLSKSVDLIEAEDNNIEEASDGTPIVKNVTIQTPDSPIHLYVDANGIVRGGQFANRHLSEIVGKSIAEKLMQEGEVTLSGDGLRIGGEGMKGFYDDMLPRFMNKYGKKWGVQVQDVTLPNVEEAGRTMHSVDVTDSMRESVMQGQPMFRVVDSKKPFKELEERYKRLDKSNTEALNAWRDEKAATIQSVITAISDELGFEPPIMVFNGGKDIQEVVDHIVDAYKEMANLDVDKEWVKTYIEESRAIGLYWPDAGVITSDVSNYDNTNDVLQASSMLMHENTHHLVNSQFDNQDLEAIWDEAVNAGHPLVNHIENKYKNVANGEKGNEVLAYAIGNIAKNTRENLFNYVKGDPISEENLLEKAEYSLPLGKFALSEILNTYKNDLRRSKEEVGGSNREANRGDHRVGRLLRNRTGIRRKAVKEAAELFASQLNTPIRIVEDANTITDDNAKLQERKRNAKGWYDPKTKEVVVVLPNNASVEDVRETIFHEVVGHKGLRELVGKERFNEFLDKVYADASEVVRERIARRAAKLGWDFRLATEEYIADLAEEGFEDRENRTFFEKVRDLFLDMLSKAKISLGFNISDNDLRYMLWRTYQMQRSKGALAFAEDMVMQQKLGVGNFAPNDTQFRVAENGSLAKRVSDIMEEYDDSEEIFTIEDVADRIEELINEYDGNDSTTTLENILNDYRDAQSEANRYGHRWDAGGEDEFEEALRLYAKQPTKFRVAEGESLKAPNGKDSNLTPEQWKMVRTKEFKNWFGDWEKPYRIEKLRRAKNAVISGTEIEESDDMKEYRKNALVYGKSLRGEYRNADTNSSIIINRDSITEVLHHDGNDVAHIQSIAAIPQLIENGIYITSEPVSQVSSEKLKNAKEVQYYACGLNIGGVPYTVKFVVAEYENGERYYDHALTQIEKGDLLNRAELSSTVADSKSPISDIKDKRLVLILQTNSSQIIDANGEPLVVWHGGEFATDEFVANGAMHFGTKTAALQRILDNAWGYGNWEVAKNEDGSWGWSYTDPDDEGYDKRSEGSFDRPIDAMEDAVNVAAPNAVVQPYFLNIRNLERTMDQNSDWEDVISESKEDGHDGIVYRNDFEDDGEDSYIAFSPEQIKLADGSNTTFDPDNNDVRFRVAKANTKISKDGVAIGVRDAYDKLTKTSKYQVREAGQDRMLSLRRFMELAVAAHGKTMDDVKDWENAYDAENQLSSKNSAEVEEFDRTRRKDVEDIIRSLMADGFTYEQIDDYLMTKHGIERNREMAIKKAISDENGKVDEAKLNAWNEAKKKVYDNQKLDSWEKEQRELDRIADELFKADRTKDYSGLTAMFEDAEDAKEAVEMAYNEVLAFEEKAGQLKINGLWKAIRAATKFSLDKMLASSVVSRETYDAINGMYAYYVPLRGFDEATSDEIYGYINNEPKAFNAPIKRAGGRGSKADQVLPNIFSTAYSAIAQGNRNKMKLRFLNFVEKYQSDLISLNKVWIEYDESKGEWIAKFPEIGDADSAEQVAAKVAAFNERMEKLSKENPKKVKMASQAVDIPYKVLPQFLSQHQIVVKRNGVDYVLTVNGSPRLAYAVNGFKDNSWLGDGSKYAKAVTNYLSGVYTQYNPDFMVSNFFRDFIYTNSTVWLKESPEYAKEFNKNTTKYNPAVMLDLFARLVTDRLDMNNDTDRLFSEFIRNGGETGYSQLASIDKLKKEIKKTLDPSLWDNTVALARKLTIVNRAVENVARFSAYVTSREQGRSISRSVKDAKEVSVNFNRKGAGDFFRKMNDQTWVGKVAAYGVGTATPLYAFFNASIQGLHNISRVAKYKPKTTGALAAGLFILGAVIASFQGDDDEEYYMLPESVRRQNIVFKGPLGWEKIPLPIEYRALYGLGELIVSTVRGKEDFSDHELPYKITEQLTQVLPINILEGKGGLGTFIPTALAPLWEVILNEDWAGYPIYRKDIFEGDKATPEHMRVYNRTGKGYVAASKALNALTGGDDATRGVLGFINPAVIEHLIDGYLGGLAQFLNKVVESGEMIAGKREFDWRHIPLANRLMATVNEDITLKSENGMYFKHSEEAAGLKKNVKNYEKILNDTSRSEKERERYRKRLTKLLQSEEWKKAEAFLEAEKEVDKAMRDIKEQGGDLNNPIIYKLKANANAIYE